MNAVQITLGILLLIVLGFGASLAYYPDPAPKPSKPEASELKLTAAKQTAEPEPVPNWMLGLIAVFSAIQILPLFVASRIAGSAPLTSYRERQVVFLCEVPMYLGLLGSLLGVCLTQFLTGAVAAPLAYLTTIIGILLYLFGKFTISLPLSGMQET